jgi:hypothetical protein
MIVQLNELNHGKLEIVKERNVTYGEQDHGRIIYKSSDLYYKLWNPEYIRAENFINAFNDGFYEKIAPALKNVIMSDGYCVGYVMYECHCMNTPHTIDEFYELLKKETERTRWFYYDWMPQHLMVYDSKPTLIDLESVYPVNDIESVLNNKYNCAVRNKSYKEFVWNIYQ